MILFATFGYVHDGYVSNVNVSGNNSVGNDAGISTVHV
jgi:hypothetical protein